MNIDLFNTPIEYLKGVGPNRAKLLKDELKIFTYKDLLDTFPYRYIDRTKFHKISSIDNLLTEVQIIGKITNLKELGIGRKKRVIATLSDDTGSIDLVWFKINKWLIESIKINHNYVVFGKLNIYNGIKSIPHPDLEIYKGENLKKKSKLIGVYPSSEMLIKKGITNKTIRNLINELLIQTNKQIDENLPEYIKKKFKLLNRNLAYISIHNPQSSKELNQSILRLKFEEIFYLQIRLIKKNLMRKEKIKGYNFNSIGKYFKKFYESILDFDLTNAQKRVIKEIRKDLGSGAQMNRLLQGDVGSGKTIVAFISALIAIGNGFQACIMTPTEILSYQHYNKLYEICKQLKINIKIISGSSKASIKKDIKNDLKDGKIDLLIGTHALIYDGIQFNN